MKIRKICNEIIKLCESPTGANDDSYAAVRLVSKLRFFTEEENFTHEALMQILHVAKKIPFTKKQILEKELLSLISYLPYNLWSESKDKKNAKFNRGDKSEDAKMANSFIKFSKEIYNIKISRDAFSGKRRGYAVEILESLSSFFDVPEFMELCSKSLSSKSKNEFLASIESLKNYCIEHKQVPGEEILNVIDKRIEKTKHRIEVVGALILQVDTGVISEFSALSTLDEWKERNDPYW